MKAGIDINARNETGNTALLAAVYCDFKPETTKKIVTTLINAGADVNAKNKHGRTPLIMASICQNSEIILVLLNAGANPKIKDSDGKTALDYAKENKNILNTPAFWKLNDALYE